MDAERLLTHAFVAAHPEDAARRLERLGMAEITSFLAEVSVDDTVELLERMAPTIAADCLPRMPSRRVGTVLNRLPLDTAAGLLRRLPEETRAPLLEAAPEDAATSLRLVLQFPDQTAGALMDPRALCAPEDITVRQARQLLRRAAHNIRYYLYVVDRARKLTGVVTLRDLFLTQGKEPINTIMATHVLRLSVYSDRTAILAHTGWRDYHTLPVVDDSGVFAGAIRYETLRLLEKQEDRIPESRAALSLAFSLGELYWLALGGMMRSLWPSPHNGGTHGPEGGTSHGA